MKCGFEVLNDDHCWNVDHCVVCGARKRARMKKIYPAIKIPNTSDDGILDFLSYQPKSDYRTLVKIKHLTNLYAVEVTFEEQE